MGEYAEETQAQFGDRAAPGGEMLDLNASTERNARAIAELGRMLQGIERQVAQLEAA